MVHQSTEKKRFDFSAREKKTLNAMGTALAVVSGVGQFVGAHVHNALLQVCVSAVLVALAIGFVVAAFRARQALLWTIAMVLAILASGFVGYLWGHGAGDPSQAHTPAQSQSPAQNQPPSQPQSTGPSSGPAEPPSAVKVVVDNPKPGDPPVAPQSPVYLSGSVEGLPAGHKLFIVSHTFGGDSDYFIVQGGPITGQNGYWTGRDGGVGSKSDPAGTKFEFIPIDANAECTGILQAAGKASDDHRLAKEDWPPAGCIVLGPPAVVTLK